MKNAFATTLFALTLALAGAAHAQDARFGIGVAAVGAFPVGDFGEFAGFGIGGMGGIEMGAYPGFAVTARAGYIQHLEKEDNKASFIPIMGGVKLNMPQSPVYLAGELGPVMARQEYTGDSPFEDDVEDTYLGWSAGIGAIAGSLDLRLSFNVWDAMAMSDAMTLSASLGFTFLSW